MNETLMSLASWLSDSSANTTVTHWLRTVPGLPPILQTFHLLGVAMVLASALVLALRSLGVFGWSQQPLEMLERLRPWLWSGFLLLLISGLPFLLARPHRYLLNPVFGIKMALLLVVLILIVAFLRLYRINPAAAATRSVALFAALGCLVLPLAGRWIAYSDYLFWPD